MTYEVVEVQNKDKTRTYNIEGPRKETVESFWNWLKANGVIDSFEIAEK